MSSPSFLDTLSTPVREALLGIARPQSFAAGTTLIRFGQPARGAYLVHAGSAQVLRSMPGGELLPIARLDAGAVFGEMALIEQGVCSATVVADTAVEAAFVEGDAFRALVARRGPESTQLQQALTAILVARVREVERRILACTAPEDRPSGAPPPAGSAGDAAGDLPADFDVAAFLPRLPFFRGFDGSEIDHLRQAAVLRRLPRGRVVCAAGDPLGPCYVIVRGAVEILLPVAGREHRLAVVGPGQLVGFVNLLEGGPRVYGIRCCEPCHLLEFAPEVFRAIHDGESALAPKLQRAVHTSLLRTIVRSNTHLTRLVSDMSLRGADAALSPGAAP